jgi:hypothetical protein
MTAKKERVSFRLQRPAIVSQYLLKFSSLSEKSKVNFHRCLSHVGFPKIFTFSVCILIERIFYWKLASGALRNFSFLVNLSPSFGNIISWGV